MDKEEVETNAVDIDIIDTIDHSDVRIIPEGIDRTDSEYAGEGIEVSDNKDLKTGTIIKQLFNLISQFRNKEYWKLDDKETKSLNKVCPKILPEIISKHSGLVTCVLNILSIIIKRMKMEQQDSLQPGQPDQPDQPDQPEESQSLTGGRTS